MKNIILFFCLVHISSCTPKYLAHFQNVNHSYNINYGVTSPGSARIINVHEITPELPPEALSVSTENKPIEVRNKSIRVTHDINRNNNGETIALNNMTGKKIRASVKPGKEPIETNPKKNAFAISGFVLGILSLVPLWGIFATIPAIVLSLIGLKSEKRKLAKIGLLLGGIGLIINMVLLFQFFAGWG